MVKLLLVRHGHVEGIHPERFRGRTDIALTQEGRRQAVASARWIASRWQPAMIYTSPLKRCIETAAQIAEACGAEWVVEEDLNDLDYGSWQWHLHTEVCAQWPELFERWLAAPHLVRFPAGESLQDLLARAGNVVRMALERHSAETVVLVSHDSVLRALLLQLLDQPVSAYRRLSPEPCSISEVDLASQGARIIGINATQHLGQASA
jgi:broad specificity phosphatase PhoE